MKPPITRKTKLTALLTATIVTTLWLACGLHCKAQGSATVPVAVAGVPADNTPATAATLTKWISFAQNVESNKSITAVLYPSYGNGIIVDGKKSPIGFGGALLYPIDKLQALSDNPIAQHTFTGVRFDYLGGKLFTPSVTVGLSGHVQLFGHDFKPFIIGGAVVPLSGAGQKNNEVGAIYGAGIATQVASFGKAIEGGGKPGSLNVFYAAEKWTIFQGDIHHFGAALTWKF